MHNTRFQLGIKRLSKKSKNKREMDKQGVEKENCNHILQVLVSIAKFLNI